MTTDTGSGGAGPGLETEPAGGAGTGPVVTPSWRGGFGRLWSAAVLSRFGDALRGAALPLLAVRLTDDPLLVSLVTACGYLPWLLFGLVGGAVADRVDQRRAMWAVDVARAVLMAAFAVAVVADRAAIVLLLVLAFALTTLQTLFDNAATALLPTVVPGPALSSANARLMTGQQLAASFAAAPLVPVVLALNAGAPYLLNALTYLVAALLVASLRAPVSRPSRPGGRTLRRDIAEGVGALWRDRVLRSLCLGDALASVGMGALIAMLVVHVTDWLAAGESGYAAVLTAYGAGSVAGGLVAGRVTRWLGQARALVLLMVGQIGCLLVLGSVRHLAAAVVALGIFGVAGMIWNVTEVTMMQQRSPAGMLGRVSAASRTLSAGSAPLGAVLGGLAAGLWGPHTPVLLTAALFLAAVPVLIPALRAPDTGTAPPAGP
ncbi:MFS transporter [Streptomyces zingiberis]|uniref:MFS transporter n=1 Tax=Streptomyces zingiberis TaxID=2053010 RepID=A0ABX1BWY9_9ACTN|nr:MFS transporter [Streptomyces zingiberis]NJQ02166.1 MFS transporter [Streptomyces zingiberis]